MTNEEKRRELLDVMEARRMESDRFAWAVPTVAIASQAFLLTIALDGDASALRRMIAAGAAIVTLLGAPHLFWKQMFGFALYEAVIKRERRVLQLRLVDRDSLLVDAHTLEERFHREWMERDVGGNLVRSADEDRHYLPRRTIRWRATRVWLWLFAIFLALDIGLVLWAGYDWDPLDWFGSDFRPRRNFPFGDD